jgi:HPt (histidine-containing phosphotransfer) domain-containing protein
VSADPATDPPTLDPESLRDLFDLLGHDRAFFDESVDAFLAEAPLRVAELREGVQAGDAALIARAAHTLKANAATFGARELENRSRALEERARAGEAAETEELVGEVESAWKHTLPLLVRLREHGPA